MTDQMMHSVRPAVQPLARSAVRGGRRGAVAGLAVLGLVLSGCSGNAGNGGPSSDTTSPTAATAESPQAGSSPSESGIASTGSSGSPSAGGSFEPATSTSPAQDVPVPVMPESVQEPTEEGLEAALEYWWETEFYLKSTGDAEPMTELSTENCLICQDLVVNWPQAYEEGIWAVRRPATVEVRVADVDDAGDAGTALVEVTEHGGQIFEADGSLLEDTSGRDTEPSVWSVAAVFSDHDGHWKIDEQDTVK